MKKAATYSIYSRLAGTLCLFMFFSKSYAQTHFNCIANTESSYSIVIEQAAIDGQPLQPGDEIAVLTPGGVCVGSVAPDSSTQVALAAWKDDPQTPEIDGYLSGEIMHFRVYDASSDLEMDAEVSFSVGDGTFENGLYSVIEMLNGVSNPAPVVSLPDTVNFPEDGSLTLSLDEVVSDPNNTDGSLTWQMSGGLNVNAQIDAGARTALIFASANWHGAEQIHFTASDSAGASGIDSVIVVVAPVNDHPGEFARLLPADSSTQPHTAIEFKWAKSNDVDGEPITYSLDVSAAGIDTSFVALQDTSYSLNFGIYPFVSGLQTVNWRVTASDGVLQTDATNGEGGFQIDVPTTVLNEQGEKLPAEYALLQNYPNPFNPSTIIAFTLPQTSHVTLSVFDSRGREISTLLDESVAPGLHEFIFDAERLSSGIYFYRLQTKDFIAQRKFLLIR